MLLPAVATLSNLLTFTNPTNSFRLPFLSLDSSFVESPNVWGLEKSKEPNTKGNSEYWVILKIFPLLHLYIQLHSSIAQTGRSDFTKAIYLLLLHIKFTAYCYKMSRKSKICLDHIPLETWHISITCSILLPKQP